MKIFIVSLLVSILTQSLWANEDEMLTAYQREYAFLVSQKDALNRQETKRQLDLQAKIQKAKSEVATLQQQVAQISVENDESFESITRLERRKKEFLKNENSLQMASRKALRLIRQNRADLEFQKLNDTNAESLADNVTISDISSRVNELIGILKSSSRSEHQKGLFLTEQDHLTEGDIFRVGRFAALGATQEGTFVLAPNGEGMLKAIEKASSAKIKTSGEALNSLYIFSSLNEMAKIRKSAGFLESAADFMPALFLIGMMIVVSGLFFLMARQ